MVAFAWQELGAEVLNTFQTTAALDADFTPDTTHFYTLWGDEIRYCGLGGWTNAQILLNTLCN